jgi:DNA-binding transcriptional ArsR family regulator
MQTKSKSSFNGQVYKKAYKRLKLKPIERVIFQRLLGFLIRNDRPFPFSTTSLSELTGYSPRAIVNALNRLEYLRLISRKGMGKNRRFSRGSILRKILTTAHYRSITEQVNNSTTAHVVPQKLDNYARGAHSKTSSSLKLKERDLPSHWQEYQEYVGNLKVDNRIRREKGEEEKATLTHVKWLLLIKKPGQ